MTAPTNARRSRRLAAVLTALAMLTAVAPTAAMAGTKCSGGTHYDDATITAR
jgi:hypothetical protein